MSSTPVTPPGGINTGVNPLSGDARGAMRTADNCVIVARDRMEPRRGSTLSSYATSSAPTTTGDFYGDALFTQHGTKLSRDTGSAFTEVGTHSPPSGASMKFAGTQGKEVNGCLYFTTSAGVYAIDSTTGTPKLSGIARPGDFYVSASSSALTQLNGNVDAGWLAKDKAIGYRAVLGRRDANNNIKLSAPSGRLIIVNPADLTIAAGGLILNTNVVTATLTAGDAHSFRYNDRISLTLTGGDIGNFTTTNNVVDLNPTATQLQWADPKANYTSVASVVITSGSKNVYLVVDLPGEAVAGDFVQIYRTLTASGVNTDPGDEMYLAYERTLTATDITNTYATITDTTPEAFLGEPLYSNANSGDGIEQANDRPPLAKDVAVFDGRVWYANATGRHRLHLRLLGTGSSVSGLQSGDLVAINTRVMVAGTNFDIVTTYSASQNIFRTIQSLVYGTTYSALGLPWKTYATHDGDNGTGGVLVEEKALGGAFSESSLSSSNPDAIYAGTSRASAFADALPNVFTVTSGASTARASNVVTVTTGSSHGFAVGQVVMLARRNSLGDAADANFPLGLKTIATTPSNTTFTYAETGSNANLSAGTPYYVYATTAKSTADTLPLMYSKPGMPDAVPLLNFIQDIPRGQTVLRIAPLREMLFVFLQHGDIWTVSGAFPYRVEKFDGTATLIAEGSLCEHANRLYCLSTQGVIAISEAGIEVVSPAIEPDLLPIMAAEALAGTLGSLRACSYESEHQYRLYLSTTSSYDVLVFNSLHRRWTKQTAGTAQGRAWGVVRRSTNKLVEGHVAVGRVWVENKTYTRLDLADLMGTFTTSTGSGNEATSCVTAFADQVAIGDIITAASPVQASSVQNAWTVTAVSGSVGSQTVTATVNDNLGAGGATLGVYLGAVGATTFYVYRPITSTLQWMHDALGAPQMEKQWRDFVLHFSRYSVASATATFSAIDGSTAATGTITSAAPQAYAIATTPTLPLSKRVNVDDVTAHVQMTPQMAPGFTVSEAFAVWTLLGYTMEVEAGAERLVT